MIWLEWSRHCLSGYDAFFVMDVFCSLPQGIKREKKNKKPGSFAFQGIHMKELFIATSRGRQRGLWFIVLPVAFDVTVIVHCAEGCCSFAPPCPWSFMQNSRDQAQAHIRIQPLRGWKSDVWQLPHNVPVCQRRTCECFRRKCSWCVEVSEENKNVDGAHWVLGWPILLCDRCTSAHMEPVCKLIWGLFLVLSLAKSLEKSSS